MEILQPFFYFLISSDDILSLPLNRSLSLFHLSMSIDPFADIDRQGFHRDASVSASSSSTAMLMSFREMWRKDVEDIYRWVVWGRVLVTRWWPQINEEVAVVNCWKNNLGSRAEIELQQVYLISSKKLLLLLSSIRLVGQIVQEVAV